MIVSYSLVFFTAHGDLWDYERAKKTSKRQGLTRMDRVKSIRNLYGV